MKLEMKPNMYIRTDKGYISKILDFEEHYTKGKRKVDYCSVKEVEENYLLLRGNQCNLIESIDYSIPPCYPSDEELEKIKSHIVKASYEILDLIELGDYVNGYEVMAISEFKDGSRYIEFDEERYLCKNYQVKSIVTKEQFSQMEYKIGE